MWRLGEVAAFTGGSVQQGDPLQTVTAVHIDSRQCTAGTLFVALRGRHDDGHRFVPDAIQRGAVAVLVERTVEAPSNVGVVRVPDTWTALFRWAAAVRDRLAARVIAVTGSMGKTTTKELIGRLACRVAPTFVSPGNWNSITGVPLSLINYGRSRAYAWWVQEVGINQRGEMARIAALLRPHYPVILNVGPVHLEAFETVEGVADEKTDLVRFMVPGGGIFIAGDVPLLRTRVAQKNLWEAPVWTFGEADGDVRLLGVTPTPTGMTVEVGFYRAGTLEDRWTLDVPILQPWNARNLLPAVGLARRLFCMGRDAVAVALVDFHPPAHRGEVYRWKQGWTLLDDSYNANPVAMAQAVRWLTGWPARRRGVIVGDMLELGPDEVAWHRRLADMADWSAIDVVITVGPRMAALADELRSRGIRAEVLHFATVEDVLPWWAQAWRPGDVWLLKASHAMGFERLVEWARTQFQVEEDPHVISPI
ncbi:MAG: UDP-N-acetylmuramoyl-tripeptide--D-alanyl-D-alanine ligase [Acidobacteria bacterium]|nr:UDP-N-acetylmuramoyl-tripeptide--D-alanyl-D-alanine ligase [Acidobacteriota bacterium]MDW7984597.1 UDP-N-acetylmuramoyl-tripeptide--D-alanyl-D-alanine ligase [Acidobacteriota bacterium]